MENIKENLGQRILRLREAAGFSQSRLAKEAGISTQTVKDIERGRTDGGVRSHHGLAKAFGLTIEDLLNETEVFYQEPKLLKISEAINRFASVPDDVYDKAFKLGDIDNEAWETVRIALDLALEEKHKKQKSKKA